MIYYKIGSMKVFRMRGSVFPSAFSAALPCASIAAALRFSINQGYIDFMEADHSILTQTQAWTGFSVLVGFLIIFRSSQAYSRFWDGCTSVLHMRAEWFDATAALISFTETSKAPKEQIAIFKHTLVRLVSMMHSAALVDLEEMNNKWGTQSDVKADMYHLLDPMGIDEESLNTLHDSNEKVMLIYQWIQLIIVHNLEAGVLSVPPPILSRAYQELAAGMVAFHECVKISDTPFPFPYAQNCELLLCLHWFLIPVVVSQWVTQALWAFVFVFMQVFVLWSLNYIAVEIENPFGTDDNDIDGVHMQEEMNRNLLLLLHPKTLRRPTISKQAVFSATPQELDWDSPKHKSFKDVWQRQQKRRLSHPGTDEASEASTETSRYRGRAVGDCLRQEAQAQHSSPCEPGAKLPTPSETTGTTGTPGSTGSTGSWAIQIKEGKCEDGRRDRDAPPLDQGRWEALPDRGGRAARGPPGRREGSSSGSEGEGGGRQPGGRRSGSRRRQQQRGKRL